MRHRPHHRNIAHIRRIMQAVSQAHEKPSKFTTCASVGASVCASAADSAKPAYPPVSIDITRHFSIRISTFMLNGAQTNIA